MVEDSKKARMWTVPRLQNAVRASFFGRGVEIRKSEEEVQLRYSDLKQRVSDSEGPVADKTLSRALNDLVDKGRLTKKRQGREVHYSLTIPRSERVTAFAKSDASAIQAAAGVGGFGDITEGWAFYGIPELLKERVRPGLERASKRFRNDFIEVVDRQVDEVIRQGLRHARGRMNSKELAKVERALYHVLEIQSIGALTMIRGGLMWSQLELVIPGSLGAWKRAIGLPEPPEWKGEWTDSHTDMLAKALGIPPDELRNVVAKEMRKIESVRPLLIRFFETLGPEEADRFGRQLGALVALVATLTAVTRV